MSQRPRLVEIRNTPLEIGECLRAVERPGAGAVSLFLGTVRNENEGEAVEVLEYEAYESMAQKEMLAIVEQLEAEIAGCRLAVLHRTGRLQVGDTAVICAASAPHRERAFQACRALIDRVKERVPIWKREYGPGKSHWVNWD